jgi:hypothetical protein
VAIHRSSVVCARAADLFVRPEDLRVADPGTTAVAHGAVAAQVYHGSHVDLYVDVAEAASARVLCASAEPTRWRAGRSARTWL